MKLPLVALLAGVIALPVISVPQPADAQVRVGGGARRDAPRRVRPAPRLSEAEQDRMYAAADEIMDINTEIAAIETAGQAAGGLTAEQQTQIRTLTARRVTAQETVDRLEAKLNR